MTKEKESYLINGIMNENRHQFIYGYNTDERTEFLKRMASKYPVRADFDVPMAIYLSNFEISETIHDDEDKAKLKIICNGYLRFCIVYNILVAIKKDVYPSIIASRCKPLLTYVNSTKNNGFSPINTFDELIEKIKMSVNFYLEYYYEYSKDNTYNKSLNSIPIPFIYLENIVKELKEMLNNNSYFAIIIDKQQELAKPLLESINSLISSRINKDIAIKTVIEPNDWTTYFDANGIFVENIHDYGTVELDDSYRTYTKKLIKKNNQ